MIGLMSLSWFVYWACRTFAIAHRQCAVHQTTLRNYGFLFTRMAGETGGGSRGCGAVLALAGEMPSELGDRPARL